MAKLYEINEELEKLWEQAVDPETGEVNDDIYEQLEALQMEKDQKVENVALWIKNLKSDADQMKEEAKKLTDRATAATNKAERLKGFLEFVLNGEKFQTPRVNISYRTSNSVEVINIDKVPPEFLRLKDPEVDKTAVKAAFKEGHDVPGCGLVSKRSMTIK